MLVKLIKKTLILIFVLFLGTLVSIYSLYLYVEKDLPQITSVEDYQPSIPSIIFDRNGNKIKEMGSENRAIVKIEDVPKKIINSFLAAEDSNFYNHFGVDPLGIARAFMANLKAGRVVQGGSTISQQVAKSFLLSKERSIIRKVKDIFLAYRIEQFLTKNEILYLYLNQVYLGGGYYGIKEAFKGYFGKDLNEVTVAESAMIAGLLVAPSKYSPYRNPKFAYMRQKYVLTRLLADNLISQEEYDAANNESIKYQISERQEQVGAHFIEYIRKEVVSRLGEDRLLRGGLKIITTLDLELQAASEKAINNGVLDIDRRQGFSTSISILETEDQRSQFILDSQEEFKEQFSTYFVIDKDYSRKLELNDVFTNMNGVINNSDFISKIKSNNYFKAFVSKIDDEHGLVFVNFLGLDGFISVKDLDWAKKRNLQTTTYWKQSLTQASEILQIGDVIYVTYKGDSINGLDLDGDALKFIDKQAKPFIQLNLFQKPEVQAASISLDPSTGEVYSMVGGNMFYPSYFNRAVQSKRQPGSALKPFVYALALQNGYTNASILYDTPESLSAGVSDFNWKPRNYDGKYLGLITFRKSLELSRNVPTIKLASELGVDNLIEFLKKIGLDGEYNQDLSTSLGSGAISLENLTLGYSLFVNGGKKNESKYLLSIKDYLGNDYGKNFEDILVTKSEASNIVSEEFLDVTNAEQSTKGVYDSRSSYLMQSLLKGVVQNGTGKKAKGLGNSVGGKTGTTSDYIDAWFIGFSSKLVTGVWVGFDDNKTLGWPESGSKAALPIWIEIMKKGISLYPEKEDDFPTGMVNVLIDRETGRLATSATENPIFEVFIEGTEPGADVLSNSGDLGESSQEKKTVSSEEFFDLR